MTTGAEAERIAANYLSKNGYSIVARNWRTKYCEIDIIAEKHSVINFVEVKYRKTVFQGTGVDYITPAKLRQMHFAAELWLQEHEYSDECSLAVLEVSGPEYIVTNFITDL